MPSGSRLPDTLGILSSPSAVLYRGTVTAVAGGLATVLIDGNTVPRVTYPKNAVPVNGDEVLLIGQEGFGITIFSIPATVTAQPAQPAPVVTLVEPSSVANRTAAAWVTAPAQLEQRSGFASAGVWFYARTLLNPMDPTRLAQVEMRLTRTGGTYVTLGLHSNTGPTGVLVPVSELPPRQLNLVVNEEVWVPLPLAWGQALIRGTSRGLTARSDLYDADLDFDGTLRFTTL